METQKDVHLGEFLKAATVVEGMMVLKKSF